MSTVNDAQQMVMSGQQPLAQPMQGAGVDAGGAGITAADVWRIVKQRKLLIGVLFCLFYAMVVAATFLVYRYAPMWTSAAYVRLIPPADPDALLGQAYLPKDYILRQLATEAAKIESANVLTEVLKDPKIKQTAYYQSFGQGDAHRFEECLTDLKDQVSAAPMRDTYLISVSASMPKASEATLFVSTVVSKHLQMSRSDVTDEGQERINTLKNRRDQLETTLQKKREDIAAARSERDMPALESDRQVQVQQISLLNNTLAELKARDADIAAQLDTIRGVDPRNLPLPAEMKVMIENDPLLRFYRQQGERLDIELSVMAKNRLGKEHRLYRELDSQRAEYLQMEAARRDELTQDYRARQVESLRQEQARMERMMIEVREQLAEHEARQEDIDQTIQKLAGWEKDEEMLEGELKQIGMQLLDAQSQLDMQKKEGRLKLAIPARDPTRPSRPRLVTWLAGGMFLSGLAAVGLAFLREFTDQALRTPIDVARYGHLAVLGCIPLLDEEEADIDEVEDATRQAPQSIIAEAFRQVRAHLTFSGPTESQRTLLITSPRPEDGKTAVAINLAVTFAQANERTLLIDCNFRRPGVRQAFQNTRSEGLSNVLIGQEQLDKLATRSELPNLDILTTGPMPPNPAELLGSRAMQDLLEKTKGQYDRVIIDGPPCLLITDALVVARLCDAVVLVARAVHGTKGTLKRAREQFGRIGARVIGAVLNGVQSRPGGYFRQQYREFYDYTDEEVVMRELPGGDDEIEQTPSDR